MSKDTFGLRVEASVALSTEHSSQQNGGHWWLRDQGGHSANVLRDMRP